MRNCVWVYGALWAVYGCTFRVSAADLIANGSFSAGNTGFVTGYVFATYNTLEGEYGVNTRPNYFNPAGSSFGDHTTGTGNMLLVNGHPTANVTAWQQTIAVEQNSTYQWIIWAASWGSAGNNIDPSPARLRFDINGVAQNSSLNLPSADGQWIQYSVDWDSSTSTSAVLRVIDLNLVGYGNDFALDDISFQKVPEPGSGLMFASLLLLVLRRRK